MASRTGLAGDGFVVEFSETTTVSGVLTRVIGNRPMAVDHAVSRRLPSMLVGTPDDSRYR